MWTPELTSRVVTLWRGGKSLTDISEELGITRGKISGKLNRMGEMGKRPKHRIRNYGRKPITTREPPGWDARTFESWENRKARLAYERNNAPA